MDQPRALPHAEVKDLLQAIIRRREERNTHDKDSHQYRMLDERLDELLELLAQQFMSSPTRGTERFPETLPPAEEEGDYHSTSVSNFDPAKELRRAVPDSLNETPADLDTTPSVEETPKQKKEREELERIYGGKITAYSMKSSLYNSLKKAPSTLFRSISSVSKKVNPFMKSKKMKKSKTKKYRKN
jgi:hypothetical protein